jgi:hypothetical protein
MRKHNGMRPQDIVVLLKIIALGKNSWQHKDLASTLKLSASEISESLNRSQIAGFLDQSKKKVRKQSLMEFLQFGLQYVFPQIPGTMVNGIPTAHAHPFMQQFFSTETPFVWASIHGNERGLSVEPLYPKQLEAIKTDDNLYKLLALIDVIRIGKLREKDIAILELKKIIMHEQ